MHYYKGKIKDIISIILCVFFFQNGSIASVSASSDAHNFSIILCVKKLNQVIDKYKIGGNAYKK
jgi:hypothetical protein